MNPWEKHRDERSFQLKKHDEGLDVASQEMFTEGFNIATEYWQKRIESIIEALETFRS